jgi:hypothetical protein
VRPTLLEPLRQAPATADLFWELCEFGAIEEAAPDWFALESGQPLHVIGRDASGGRFCLHLAAGEGGGRLWYIDSEGSAGVIASSLAEGVQMMVALPYWRDCLKFSGGGELSEMRKAQARSEADLRQRRPGINADREVLYRAFRLATLATPLEALHRAVTEGAGTNIVATSDRTPFASLFNTFVVEDCPLWRQPAD